AVYVMLSPLQRPRQRRDELLRVYGLGDVVVEAAFDRPEAIFVAREGGEGDGGDGWSVLGQLGGADFLDQGVAVHVGHGDVAEDQVGRGFGKFRERRGGAEDGRDARSGGAEKQRDCPGGLFVVFDKQDVRPRQRMI